MNNPHMALFCHCENGENVLKWRMNYKYNEEVYALESHPMGARCNLRITHKEGRLFHAEI